MLSELFNLKECKFPFGAMQTFFWTFISVRNQFAVWFISVWKQNLHIADDSWLTLTPESLEQMLKARGGNSQTRQDDSGDTNFDLSKIADSMKTFVGNVSGIEGAEFPK